MGPPAWWADSVFPRVSNTASPLITFDTLVTGLGGDEAFGEASSGDGRWRTLLASGSRVGEEFGTAWRSLQGEAEAAAAWLGEEVEGPLTIQM